MNTSKTAVSVACLKAQIAVLSPKKRLKFLRVVTEALGDPGVIKFDSVASAKTTAEAQALWAAIVPALMAKP